MDIVELRYRSPELRYRSYNFDIKVHNFDIEVLNFNIVVLNFDICVLNARPGAGDRVRRARRRTAAARAARYRKKG